MSCFLLFKVDFMKFVIFHIFVVKTLNFQIISLFKVLFKVVFFLALLDHTLEIVVSAQCSLIHDGEHSRVLHLRSKGENCSKRYSVNCWGDSHDVVGFSIANFITEASSKNGCYDCTKSNEAIKDARSFVLQRVIFFVESLWLDYTVYDLWERGYEEEEASYAESSVSEY